MSMHSSETYSQTRGKSRSRFRFYRPWPRGSGKLIRKIVTLFPQFRFVRFQIYDKEICIDHLDQASLGFFLTGTIKHEAASINLIADCLMSKPGSVFFDVGANVGFYTLFFSQKQYRVSAIYAFEPNPSLAVNLIEATNQNTSPKIRVFQAGLGEGRSHLVLYFDDNSSSDTATFRQQSIKLGKKIANVEVFSLDYLITSGEAPPPDVIKLDVEGFEYYIIRGYKLIEKHRPLIVMEWVEEFMQSIGVTFQDLMAQFSDGWVFLDIVSGEKYKLQRIQRIPQSRDIVLLHEDSKFAYLIKS